MTALIVIQPTRGLLLEKSFYRLLATAVGCRGVSSSSKKLSISGNSLSIAVVSCGEALLSLSQLSRRPGSAAQVLENAAHTLYEVLGKGLPPATVSGRFSSSC